MTSTLALTLPLLPGRMEAWYRFCQELSGTRKTEYEASCLRLGITHQQLSLVESPLGLAVLMSLSAEDVGQAQNGAQLVFEWTIDQANDDGESTEKEVSV